MGGCPTVLAAVLALLALETLKAKGEGVRPQRWRRDEGDAVLPVFVEEVPNITVTLGREALLPCTVEHLHGFKVAWVQVDTQTILTIHKQVITRNPRIALLHNDHRSWHLELKNVREKDRGWYMCQVNTDPMRYRQGYVDVVVPPDIIDRESSGDITVREGQDVTLTCRAKGHPRPSVVWRREDGRDIILEEGRSVRVAEESTLQMRSVSRMQMGSYLCIASNGIPPSISKRTQLNVQFPPVAWVPEQLVGAYLGQEVAIECHTEAFPRSISYWMNPKGNMIVAGKEYQPEVVMEDSYRSFMTLRILHLRQEHLGTFLCVAKNSLGEMDGAIRIYETEQPHSQLTSGSNKEEDEVSNFKQTSKTTYSKGPKKIDSIMAPKRSNDVSDYQHGKQTGAGHSTPGDQNGHQGPPGRATAAQATCNGPHFLLVAQVTHLTLLFSFL